MGRIRDETNITDPCVCAQLHDSFGDGAFCAPHTPYTGQSRNDVWCYANNEVCKDAKLISNTLIPKGYGASKSACKRGMHILRVNA